tara:strand:- start:945 stop:2159 length:1215 start_codon:yes stop_codon:yes gene_type:complete
MASWILSQQWLLSIVVILLMLNERHTSKYLGGSMSYSLWLMIPVAITINSFAQYLALGNDSQISRYIVNLNAQSAQMGDVITWQLIWALGAIIVALASIYSTLGNRFKLDLIPLKKAQLPITLPKSLRAFHTSEVSGPMLIGVLTPKLVLPSDFHQLYNRKQQQLILQHELCHYSRKDNLMNLFALIALSCCWFNPLVWLGYRNFRKSQEIACDSYVLQQKSTSDRLEYGKALVHCAQSAQHRLCIDTNYTQRNIMFKRINMLKDHRSVNRPAQLVAGLFAGLFMTSIALANPPTPKDTSKSVEPEIRIQPRYPISAANDDITGSVVLKFDIMPAGNVMNISVVKSVPEGIFDKESRRALKQWKYKPSTNGTKDTHVQLDFVLADNGKKPLNLMDDIEKINVNQ